MQYSFSVKCSSEAARELYDPTQPGRHLCWWHWSDRSPCHFEEMWASILVSSHFGCEDYIFESPQESLQGDCHCSAAPGVRFSWSLPAWNFVAGWSSPVWSHHKSKGVDTVLESRALEDRVRGLRPVEGHWMAMGIWIIRNDPNLPPWPMSGRSKTK